MELRRSVLSSGVSVSKEKAGCDVFVGVMPIRLPPFSPRSLAQAVARAGALHFYTVIQPPSPDYSECDSIIDRVFKHRRLDSQPKVAEFDRLLHTLSMSSTQVSEIFPSLVGSSWCPYIYFDFLPENTEDPFVAVGALLGQKVPGIVQERKLRRLPSKSCWWIGKSEDKGLESVKKFNSCWDNQLMLFQHDCRHYTDALVGHLTGKMGVIEHVVELRRRDIDPAQRFTDYQ